MLIWLWLRSTQHDHIKFEQNILNMTLAFCRCFSGMRLIREGIQNSGTTSNSAEKNPQNDPSDALAIRSNASNLERVRIIKRTPHFYKYTGSYMSSRLLSLLLPSPQPPDRYKNLICSENSYD